jgi:dienelactone hydrolase
MSTSELTFPSGGESVAATLYRPQSGAGTGTCVVMGHGFTLTRRDGIPAYAQRFVASGIAVLAFDYRHWGDSAGQPRRWVSIAHQLADWKAAVAYARQLEGVDPERIVVWGMSMGGGHAFITAAEDPRIAAFLGLLPTMDRLVAYPRSLGGARMFAYALAEATTRRPFRIAATGRPGTFAVATAPEAPAGFAQLAADSEWRNEVNTSWLLAALRWHPVRYAKQVRVPVLLQLGERDRAISAAPIEQVAAQVHQAELKRYDIDHFGCFQPECLGQMASDQIEFLRRHLGAG